MCIDKRWVGVVVSCSRGFATLANETDREDFAKVLYVSVLMVFILVLTTIDDLLITSVLLYFSFYL